MDLKCLVEMSRRYGADERYVLAGGGNTSCKERGIMYVKGSGVELSDISAERFVGMDVEKLRSGIERYLSADAADDSCEAAALSTINDARLPGCESKRPSVESILHALFPYKYVLHVHPALVNGMTCGRSGVEICHKLFGNDALWIPAACPGFDLAVICKNAFAGHCAKTGEFPQLVFLQNHGLFIAAATVPQIDAIMADVWNKLSGTIVKEPDFDDVSFDRKKVRSITSALKTLYPRNENGAAINILFCVNRQLAGFVACAKAFRSLAKPFTPDHVLYYGGKPLFIDNLPLLPDALTAYRQRRGFAPKIVAVQELGFFAFGKTEADAGKARALFLNAAKIAVYAESFGGAQPMSDKLAESMMGYRAV